MNKFLQRIGTAFAMLGAFASAALAGEVNVAFNMSTGFDKNDASLAAGFGISADGMRVAVDAAEAVVKITGSVARGDEHSAMDMPVATFKTEGSFKLSLGTCQYGSGNFDVYIDGVKAGSIDNKGASCYHQDKSVASEVFDVEAGKEVDVEVKGGQYMPFISIKPYVAPAEPVKGGVPVAKDMTSGFNAEEHGAGFGINGKGEVVALDAFDAVINFTGQIYRGDIHSVFDNPVVTFKTTRRFELVLGTCQYGSGNFDVYIDGVKNGSINNKAAICYHQDPATGITKTYKYNTTPAKEVEVKVKGGNYIPYISLVFLDDLSEQCLYSTNFTEWTESSKSATETTVDQKTKYSHETLSFSFKNVNVLNHNGNVGKFPDWTGGYMMCDRTADTYIETSVLASITKVSYFHGATGGSRGWKLLAKGDGDADWVVVSDAFANPATGQRVEKEINKTNCKLRFENLNASQNAYLFDLNIFGMVDLSKTPSLLSVNVNEKDYECADAFAEDNDGNMAATFEISKSVDMESVANAISFVVSNGETGEPVKTYAGENFDKVGTVKIPVSANGTTIYYVLKLVYKPDFTFTYYNVDGTVIGSQVVEKDAAIGEFVVGADKVTVAQGKAFRGWFHAAKADNNVKFSVDDVAEDNTALYAVCTDIEGVNPAEVLFYDLRKTTFYPEDHESFVVEGKAVWHDAQHGWAFEGGSKIQILVGGDATILVGCCQYSNDNVTIELQTEDGTVVSSIANGKVGTDGSQLGLSYAGPAAKLYITFGGTAYVHNLKILNTSLNPIEKQGAWYFVAPGSGQHFLTVLDIACANSSVNERTYIFLPNGIYDLGETVLTPISGFNISIIGESMEGTVIRNAPDKKIEGIGTTATLLNTSSNLYMQDLTLSNELDYYASGSAGRAVCLQDKGSNTICKNVKMLSYQDTYYSNKASNFYWEDSEIHGTVDFLCGDGNVVYNRTNFVVEKRAADGKGECTIAAPYNTPGTCDYGYVMLNCKITNYAEKFNLGRAWGGKPNLYYINTTLVGDAASKINPKRFTEAGMNVAANEFMEYNTVNEAGEVVSPASNVLTFVKDKNSNTMETIMTAEKAAGFTVEKIYGNWAPDLKTIQVKTANVVVKDGVATWEAVEGTMGYAIYVNGEYKTVVAADVTSFEVGAVEKVEVRTANAMGGFGEKVAASNEGATGLESVYGDKEVANVEFYTLGGQKSVQANRGLNLVKVTYTDGSVKTSKVLVK